MNEEKPKAKKAAPARAAQKDVTCADCHERPAVSKGLCSRCYTRMHRRDPANLAKAREASRRYTAKKKAEREAVSKK